MPCCSFMLGYHVHEKAVLAVTVPAALGAVADRRAAGEYLFLATVSTYALFPLLFTAAEYPIKVSTCMSHLQNFWSRERPEIDMRDIECSQCIESLVKAKIEWSQLLLVPVSTLSMPSLEGFSFVGSHSITPGAELMATHWLL